MPVVRHPDHIVWDGGWVPKGADAITLGRLVVVRRGRSADRRLMRHELVHVRQWRRLGVVRFTARYLGSYAKWRLLRKGHQGAYRRIPMEVEADWVARRAGTPLNVQQADRIVA